MEFTSTILCVAYREAVANAIVHRDYTIEADGLIINYIEENKQIDRKTAEKLVGLKKTYTVEILNNMMLRGFIVRVGKGRGLFEYWIKGRFNLSFTLGRIFPIDSTLP